MSVNDYRNQQTTDLFEVQAGPSTSSSTFIFGNEDHTLGNALRHVLMNRTETEFCGYSVPHPYEPKMNIRLQVSKAHTAHGVLLAGLKDVEEACNVLDDEFIAALQRHEKQEKASGSSSSKSQKKH